MKRNLFRTIVLVVLTAMASNVYAQFKVSVGNSSDPTIKFVTAFNTESSTFLYLTKTAHADDQIFTCGRLTASAGYKKFKMKNCYNVPTYNEAEPAYDVLDKAGQEQNFIVEFELLPMNTNFDIVEENLGEDAIPWKFSNMMIDTLSRMEFINPNDFLEATPAKYCGDYATDGTYYTYYMYNGIVLTANFVKSKNYGKYYTVYLDIINNSDHSVAFNIENVEAEGYTMKKGVETTFAMKTLSAEEYDKKVRRKQAWNSFFNDLGQAMAANDAGKTTVNAKTTTNTSGYSNTTTGYAGGSVYGAAAAGTGGAAVGYGASAYGGVASSNTYSNRTTTTNTSIEVHDGAVQYMAQQQASRNIAAYHEALAYDRANLWENYLKANTIRTGESYGGFFNIEYKKADGVKIRIKIDGEVYLFVVGC